VGCFEFSQRLKLNPFLLTAHCLLLNILQTPVKLFLTVVLAADAARGNWADLKIVVERP
jgi:hypothetical protein